MADISRWLPFKSKRKAEESKTGAEVPVRRAEQAQPQAALSPTTTPMQQWIQRMFDEPFFNDPLARFSEFDRWFGDFAPARFQPSVDVVDQEDALVVTAELPGMAKDDIKLSIDNDVLTIHGEKRNEEQKKEQGVYRTERYYGYFQRGVPLPSGLDIDKAEAQFKDGVLNLRLPKGAPQPEAGRQIPIKT